MIVDQVSVLEDKSTLIQKDWEETEEELLSSLASNNRGLTGSHKSSPKLFREISKRNESRQESSESSWEVLSNSEDSFLQDSPVDKRYSQFVLDLYRVLGEELWVDEPGGVKWIDKVEAMTPSNKSFYNSVHSSLPGMNFTIHEKPVWSTENGLKVNESKKAQLFSISAWDGIPWDNYAINQYLETRKIMKGIFAQFFSSDWELNKELTTDSELVPTRYFAEKSSDEGASKTVLVFVRKYEGGYYYLKVTFNVPITKNSLFLGTVGVSKLGGGHSPKKSIKLTEKRGNVLY